MVKIVQINLGRRASAAVCLTDLINLDNYEIALIQEPYTFKKIIGKLSKNGAFYENSSINENPRACGLVKISINLLKQFSFWNTQIKIALQ